MPIDKAAVTEAKKDNGFSDLALTTQSQWEDRF